MICQPKEDDTKNLNVSVLLAQICLPLPQAREEAGLSLSISDSERPGGCTDKVNMKLGTQKVS